MEIFSLGPAHNPGNTYYSNIHELKPGNYGIFIDGNLKTNTYWDLKTKENADSIIDSIHKIKELVSTSLKEQIISDVPICSMLSGGLDSSILTYLAKNELGKLSTFSIDFVDNSKEFLSNSYQPTQDKEYIDIMRNYLNTNHTTFSFESSDLFELLEDSMKCRAMPGMADIDASMLAFCTKIANSGYKIAISGECSDEIFGGYPWYYKQHLINSDSFPWALSTNIRENVINKNILKKYNIRDYIDSSYQKTLENITYNSSNELENKFRKINYLTIKWFMNTLIERTDRASSIPGLEVRIPFADYRLFEYVYNLPASYKLGLTENNEPVEKYLLRKAFENDIPKEIVYRKKSPFPKTYGNKYLESVENKMKKIISEPSSPINALINKEYINNLILSHGNSLKENWFGQLMTYPQTLAYLIQINMWLIDYNINIDI